MVEYILAVFGLILCILGVMLSLNATSKNNKEIKINTKISYEPYWYPGSSTWEHYRKLFKLSAEEAMKKWWNK